MDADFNELADILQHRVGTQITDLIGRSGVPESGGLADSFEVIAQDGKLSVKPGRIYVDGTLCENNSQRDLELVDDSGGGLPPGSYLVFLDSWQREVTHLEDPLLADPALRGADTAVRGKNTFAVRFQPLAVEQLSGEEGQLVATRESLLEQIAALTEKRKLLLEHLRKRIVPLDADGDMDGALRKFEAARKQLGNPDLPDPERAAIEESVKEVAQYLGDRLAKSDKELQRLWHQNLEILERLDDLQRTLAQVPKVVVDVPPFGEVLESLRRREEDSARPTLRPSTAPFHADFDNRLYRIEIHRSGPPGSATFKWSRDNASYACRGRLDRNRILVERWTHGSHAQFLPGDWVEVKDALRLQKGQPGSLVRLADVADNVLTLPAGGHPGQPSTEDVFVVRWDGVVAPTSDEKPSHQRADHSAISHGIPIAAGADQEIEQGLAVRFELPEDAVFRAGDYWLVPTRSGSDPLLWPRADNDAQASGYAARPPHGVRHRYGELAVLELGGKGEISRLDDVRRRFAPSIEGAVRKTGDRMTGPLTIQDALTVTGQTTLDSRLTVRGGAEVAGGMDVKGSLRVTASREEKLPALEITSQTTLPFEDWGDAVRLKGPGGRDNAALTQGSLLLGLRGENASVYVADTEKAGEIADKHGSPYALVIDAAEPSTKVLGRLDVRGGATPTAALYVRSDPRRKNHGGVIHHQDSSFAWQQCVASTGDAGNATMTFHVVERQAPENAVHGNVLVLSGRDGGSVGVGAAPDTRLHVAGSGKFEGSLVVANGANVQPSESAAMIVQLPRGGGRLLLTNNENDDSIYFEGFSRDGAKSAPKMVFSGAGARNIATLELRASVTDVQGRLQAKQLSIGGNDVAAKLGELAEQVAQLTRRVDALAGLRILAMTMMWTATISSRWKIRATTGGLNVESSPRIGAVTFERAFEAPPAVIVTPPLDVPSAPYGPTVLGHDVLRIINITNRGFQIDTPRDFTPQEGNVYSFVVVGRA